MWAPKLHLCPSVGICGKEWLMSMGFGGAMVGGRGWAPQAMGHKVQMLGLGFFNSPPPNCTCGTVGCPLSKWVSIPRSLGSVSVQENLGGSRGEWERAEWISYSVLATLFSYLWRPDNSLGQSSNTFTVLFDLQILQLTRNTFEPSLLYVNILFSC